MRHHNHFHGEDSSDNRQHHWEQRREAIAQRMAEKMERKRQHMAEKIERRIHGHFGHGPQEEQGFGPGRHHFGRRGGPFGRHGGPFSGPFGPGGPFGRHGGPDRPGQDDEHGPEGRQRKRRGDIKFALLELLAEQPRHGYDLIKELEQRYGGFYRPSPGSVYPTLQMLEDEGHLTSESSSGKRIYSVTDCGRQLLAEHKQQEPQEPRHGRRGPMGAMRPELDELRNSSEALIAGIMQVARHGSPDQAKAVMEMLDATRREVYRILAGSDDEHKD